MPQGRWLTSLTIDGLTVGRRLALAATISEAVHERLGTLTVAAHACRSTLLKIITLFTRHGDAAEMTAVLLLTLAGITPLRVSARVFTGNERRTFFTLLHLIAGSGRTLTAEEVRTFLAHRAALTDAFTGTPAADTVRLLFSLAAGLTEGSSLLLSSLSSAGDVIYITPTGLTVIAALTVETRITPARVQRLLTAGRAVSAAGGTVSVLTGPAATIARAFRDAMSDTPAAPRALFTSDTDGKPLTGFRLGQETVTLPGTAAPALLAAFGRALTRVREMLLSAPETAPFFLLGTTDVRFTQRSRFTAVFVPLAFIALPYGLWLSELTASGLIRPVPPEIRRKNLPRGVALRRDASADRLTAGVLLNTARFMSLPVTKQRTALLTDEKTLVNDAMKPLTPAALKAKEEPQIPPRLLQPAVTERDEAVLADAFPEKLPAKLKTMTLVDLIEHFVRTERSKQD